MMSKKINAFLVAIDAATVHEDNIDLPVETKATEQSRPQLLARSTRQARVCGRGRVLHAARTTSVLSTKAGLLFISASREGGKHVASKHLLLADECAPPMPREPRQTMEDGFANFTTPIVETKRRDRQDATFGLRAVRRYCREGRLACAAVARA
jgi:hypothetical protein